MAPTTHMLMSAANLMYQLEIRREVGEAVRADKRVQIFFNKTTKHSKLIIQSSESLDGIVDFKLFKSNFKYVVLTSAQIYCIFMNIS